MKKYPPTLPIFFSTKKDSENSLSFIIVFVLLICLKSFCQSFQARGQKLHSNPQDNLC